MRTAAFSLLFIAVAFSAYAAPVRQSRPVVASDGTGFVAIWTEGQYPKQSLVASRIGRDGQMFDEPPITIFDAPALTYNITFGGSDYLVVWTSGSSLLARRITSAAMFVDAQPIQIDAESPNAPAAAWNGDAFLVVWGEWHQGGGGVFGAIIATDGSVSSKRAIETSEPSDPQVAWSGSQFVVLWPSNGMCDGLCYSGGHGIHTARVAADGFPIDTVAPLRFPDALNTALASNGADSLVVYDGRNGETSGFIVSPNGDQLQTNEPRTVFRWFTPAWSSAAWDGRGYLVASRYGTALPTGELGDNRWWLAVTRISPDGTPVSASVTTTNPPEGTPPSIAANSLGEFVILQSELTGDIPRVQTYVASQFEPSPPLPAVPELISAMFNGRSTTVTWRSDGRNVEGYIVDEEPRAWIPLVIADRNARSAVLSITRGALRVRAFNTAGISEASDALPISVLRRRAASR